MRSLTNSEIDILITYLLTSSCAYECNLYVCVRVCYAFMNVSHCAYEDYNK